MRFSISGQRFCRKGNRRQLPFPTTVKLRIAQISAVSNPFFSATAFPESAWSRLKQFRAQVLVGSGADMQRLSERAPSLGADIGSVDRALVILTNCEEEPLSDVKRVVLWQAFGVPIYELIIAADLVIAAECLAHEGWHIEPGIAGSLKGGEFAFKTWRGRSGRVAFPAELVDETCPCGRPGHRLVMRAAQQPIDVRQLAAIA